MFSLKKQSYYRFMSRNKRTSSVYTPRGVEYTSNRARKEISQATSMHPKQCRTRPWYIIQKKMRTRANNKPRKQDLRFSFSPGSRAETGVWLLRIVQWFLSSQAYTLAIMFGWDLCAAVLAVAVGALVVSWPHRGVHATWHVCWRANLVNLSFSRIFLYWLLLAQLFSRKADYIKSK